MNKYLVSAIIGAGALAAFTGGVVAANAQYERDRGQVPRQIPRLEDFFDRDYQSPDLLCNTSSRTNRYGQIYYLRMECRSRGYRR